MEKKKYPIGPENYVLHEEIGQGATASVHRALCVPFNEIVAIKILDFERDNADLVKFLSFCCLNFFSPWSSYYIFCLLNLIRLDFNSNSIVNIIERNQVWENIYLVNVGLVLQIPNSLKILKKKKSHVLENFGPSDRGVIRTRNKI